MRPSKLMAVTVGGCALGAAAIMPAVANAAHSAPTTSTHGTFPSSLSPKTAHTGTKMTLTAHGAEKKTNYICIFAIVKGKAHGQDLSNATTVKSSSKGKFSCSLHFKPFSASLAGKTRHCPQTKADKKAGVKCGFAAADPANSTASNTIQYFTPKK